MSEGQANLIFGLLGASRIAPHALVTPAARVEGVRIGAVAARDLGRAQAFASQHGIPLAIEGYDGLFQAPGVNAVYNALPNTRHADVTIAALRAGLHVLCEKPFATTVDEARAMVSEADSRSLILMEAFHYRYHPMFVRIVELVQGGTLGDVRRLEAKFHAPLPQTPGEIRYDAALAGGALMDLGTYCLHWVRAATGLEPVVVDVEQRRGETGVDLATRVELHFPGGVPAVISCDMTLPFEASLVVEGAYGRLRAVNPLAPQMGHALQVETDGKSRTERFTERPTYEFQLEAFAEAVSTGNRPLTGGADAVAQMDVLDAIRKAASG